jgi:hypothetical protein
VEAIGIIDGIIVVDLPANLQGKDGERPEGGIGERHLDMKKYEETELRMENDYF